jgi:molecular chaperone GrpE
LSGKTVKLDREGKRHLSVCPFLVIGKWFGDSSKNNGIMSTQDSENKQEELNSQEELNEQQVNEEASGEPTWEEKYLEMQDKYLRLYSDFDNYRKRTMKEKAELIAQAGSDILKDILPVLDDFERAVKNNEGSTDADAIKEGVKLVHHKFETVLQAHGVKEMEAQGAQFDGDLHEAITSIPAPSEELKGKVVDVVQKGYYLKEKVLRYAKVVVGQ